MPSKEEVLASIKNEAHSGAMVKHLISSIKVPTGGRFIPEKLRKGDVFFSPSIGQSNKERPIVITRVLEEIIIGIPLTTTKGSTNLVEGESRFFGSSKFSRTIISVDKEYALNNFCGVYDNPRALNRAIKEMKQFLTKNLK